MILKKISKAFAVLVVFAFAACAAGESAKDAGESARENQTASETASPVQNSNGQTPEKSATEVSLPDENAEKNDAASGERFKFVKPAHARVLENWLASKPGLGLAPVEDFPKAQLERFRDWKKDQTAHPFYATGDFDRDQTEEFAVLLNNDETEDSRSLAVFEPGAEKPDFYTDKMYKNYILSFDKDKKDLYIGSFESDDGVILTPKNGGYVLKSMLPDVD